MFSIHGYVQDGPTCPMFLDCTTFYIFRNAHSKKILFPPLMQSKHPVLLAHSNTILSVGVSDTNYVRCICTCFFIQTQHNKHVPTRFVFLKEKKRSLNFLDSLRLCNLSLWSLRIVLNVGQSVHPSHPYRSSLTIQKVLVKNMLDCVDNKQWLTHVAAEHRKEKLLKVSCMKCLILDHSFTLSSPWLWG